MFESGVSGQSEGMLRRLYPLAAGGGVIAAALTVAAGRIDASSGSFGMTIGQAAALDRGATELSAALLGLASLGLLAGMRSARAPIAGWPERLMLTWALALLGAAVVPYPQAADVLVAVALVCMAVAAALLARRFGEDARWAAAARPTEWLALGAGGGLAVLTYIALPGHQVMIGLVEWSLLGIEVAVLGVSAGQLMRLSLLTGRTAQAPVLLPAPAVSARGIAQVNVQASAEGAPERGEAGRRAGQVQPGRTPITAIMAMAVTMENAATGARNTTPVLSRR
ncbi:hypothetical protein Sme01_33260 [Sphaerisporangium melleum]|uniref:DUF998 domain-containing protein n=1 Tax=Sphaerisporangium melleum TaxID=321316 RepID=A0A917VFS0_9ACTN|nr:hypothetical protein [Sphaerisporangium melleum]GGK73916.1 hypothetical protein GCM10007964_15920 [Sphaerisporangium melleum]GII70850.1 hypothetical protein Sme01_33260 [Sphaerisporangium melleum]